MHSSSQVSQSTQLTRRGLRQPQPALLKASPPLRSRREIQSYRLPFYSTLRRDPPRLNRLFSETLRMSFVHYGRCSLGRILSLCSLSLCSKHSLDFDSSFIEDCSNDLAVAEWGSRRLVQGGQLLVGHMPVVGHRLVRRRDLNPVPALLEEAVHRPLRVQYGPVDPHVVQNPFSDLLAG